MLLASTANWPCSAMTDNDKCLQRRFVATTDATLHCRSIFCRASILVLSFDMTYQSERKLERCNENTRDSVSQVSAYLNDGDGHLLNSEALKVLCDNIPTIDVPSTVRQLKNTNNLVTELEKLLKLEQNRRIISTELKQEQKRGI